MSWHVDSGIYGILSLKITTSSPNIKKWSLEHFHSNISIYLVFIWCKLQSHLAILFLQVLFFPPKVYPASSMTQIFYYSLISSPSTIPCITFDSHFPLIIVPLSIYVYIFKYRFCIWEKALYFSFWVWFISLDVMICSSVYFLDNLIVWLIFTLNKSYKVYLVPFFIYYSVIGYVKWYLYLLIVNSIAIAMHVYLTWADLYFFSYLIWKHITGSHGSFI